MLLAPQMSNERTPAVKLVDTDPEPEVRELSAVIEEEDGSVVVEAVLAGVLLAVVELQIAAQRCQACLLEAGDITRTTRMQCQAARGGWQALRAITIDKRLLPGLKDTCEYVL